MSRPTEILNAISRACPQAWDFYAHMLRGRGHEYPDWPSWCFCPIAGAISAIADGDPTITRDDVHRFSLPPGILAGLAAWRATRGVYRFAPEVYEALITTPVDTLPPDVLYALPEWCVYIETPNAPCSGFFAYLESDANDGRAELRLILDCEAGLQEIVIHLTGCATIREGIVASADENILQLTLLRGDQRESIDAALDARNASEAMARALSPLISLVLYLCSEAPDIADAGGKRGVPTRTSPLTKTKAAPQGRFFQADRETVWETAFSLARQMRTAQRASYSTDNLSAVTPHIRRAHWHSFWTGPKSEPAKRRVKLRWLHPILVNADLGDMPSETVRNVK